MSSVVSMSTSQPNYVRHSTVFISNCLYLLQSLSVIHQHADEMDVIVGLYGCCSEFYESRSRWTCPRSLSLQLSRISLCRALMKNQTCKGQCYCLLQFINPAWKLFLHCVKRPDLTIWWWGPKNSALHFKPSDKRYIFCMTFRLLYK